MSHVGVVVITPIGNGARAVLSRVSSRFTSRRGVAWFLWVLATHSYQFTRKVHFVGRKRALLEVMSSAIGKLARRAAVIVQVAALAARRLRS